MLVAEDTEADLDISPGDPICSENTRKKHTPMAEDTEADLDMLKEQQQMIQKFCTILAEVSLQTETHRLRETRRGCEQMRLMRLEQIRFVRMRGGGERRIASASGWFSPASATTATCAQRTHQPRDTLRRLLSGPRMGRSRAPVAPL